MLWTLEYVTRTTTMVSTQSIVCSTETQSGPQLPRPTTDHTVSMTDIQSVQYVRRDGIETAGYDIPETNSLVILQEAI